ncbi:hypothetical protein ACFSCX_11555 [Bacillus salitolerans]|uniref:Uncharacterized protein n=1 Tax=Bacillus salitolerans TaxID=1437434 RepID=A0ABW4LRP3_9BACI
MRKIIITLILTGAFLLIIQFTDKNDNKNTLHQTEIKNTSTPNLESHSPKEIDDDTSLDLQSLFKESRSKVEKMKNIEQPLEEWLILYIVASKINSTPNQNETDPELLLKAHQSMEQYKKEINYAETIYGIEVMKDEILDELKTLSIQQAVLFMLYEAYANSIGKALEDLEDDSVIYESIRRDISRKKVLIKIKEKYSIKNDDDAYSKYFEELLKYN